MSGGEFTSLSGLQCDLEHLQQIILGNEGSDDPELQQVLPSLMAIHAEAGRAQRLLTSVDKLICGDHSADSFLEIVSKLETPIALIPNSLIGKYRPLSIGEAVSAYRGGSERVFFEETWQRHGIVSNKMPTRIVEWIGSVPADGRGRSDHLGSDLGGDWWRLEPGYDAWVRKWERKNDEQR